MDARRRDGSVSDPGRTTRGEYCHRPTAEGAEGANLPNSTMNKVLG